MMFSLAAYEKKKTAAKCADFFCGYFVGSTVMSRPNMALMSVVMVPLYLNVLCRKDIKTKVKLLSVLSFALLGFCRSGISDVVQLRALFVGVRLRLCISADRCRRFKICCDPGSVFACDLSLLPAITGL